MVNWKEGYWVCFNGLVLPRCWDWCWWCWDWCWWCWIWCWCCWWWLVWGWGSNCDVVWPMSWLRKTPNKTRTASNSKAVTFIIPKRWTGISEEIRILVLFEFKRRIAENSILFTLKQFLGSTIFSSPQHETKAVTASLYIVCQCQSRRQQYRESLLDSLLTS